MSTRVEPEKSSVRPSGTVTFLFSDIEGSTERWQRDRDAMSAALARHDVLVRAALEARGGYIFKTVGDAFCASFATASDAVAAALDAQRALIAQDFSSVNGLRVRMALHTGTAEERNGDYFGPTVNRVARLLAIGHGGQVLISGATAELLHGELPLQSSLCDLGEHRLRDLAHVEHVWQLIAPNLQESFPALRSLNELANNLPLQLTSFVGRENVVAEIKALIESHRLVTVVGTGGAGKTRCAIQVGAQVLDRLGDGVWLVELAQISDPAFVTNAVAQTLNVQEQPSQPLLATLVAYLKRKRLLLMLDNCEHVIGEVRTIVSALLRACPDVLILATSREPLNISGEETYRMPSLTVPSSEVISKEGISGYGAVQLFVDRAVSSDKRFALTEENAPHVADICRRLDGIPLAIELAAARVKVLSPKQLAQKLDDRFRVLTGGDRSALPRQQTMRALIDWSYDLLTDDERMLFRKLSIFAGGVALETASAVCRDERIDDLAILDLLSSLVDKSLVQAESAESGTRYRLLDSTRQYAREKLLESGEEELTARAHAEAFVTLAEQFDRDLETMPDYIWFARVEQELENLRGALAWAMSEHGDMLLAQQLAGAPRFGWLYFAPVEARRWVRAALAAVGAATPGAIVAKLYLADAEIDSGLMEFKASYASAEQALAKYRDLGDPLGMAHALRIAGGALAVLGQIEEGELLLSEALAAARALSSRRLTGMVLDGLANMRSLSNDVAGARAQYGEVLAIYKDLGDELTTANVAADLADAEFLAGDALAALKLVGEAIIVDRRLNNTRGVTNHLYNMAAYLIALDRYDEARAFAREAVALTRDLQVPVLFSLALQHLGAVAALRTDQEVGRDDRVRAARLLGYVDARLTALEALREYAEQQEYDKIVVALRNALGDELAKLMSEGRDWSEDQAVAEAMLV